MTKGFIKKALHISLHAPKKPRALKLLKLATPADLPQMNEKIKEAPFAAGWRHNFDDGGFIPTPPRRPVELSGDDASRAFPAIWKNVNPIVKYNMGRQGGYAETYPPRETGDPKNPKSIRPKEFGKAGPNARTGIEVYRPEMTGSDLALELLHADPRAISTRNTLLPTISPEQLEELRHREDYKYSIEEKLPQKKAYENAMDAAARSYLANKRDLPHNQGPARDIDYMNYTDEQKKHLDNLYNYMMTGEYARGGEVWDKPRPKDLGKPHHLSSKQKASAKAAAKAAGRPYPNLIDNMRAAREDGGSVYNALRLANNINRKNGGHAPYGVIDYGDKIIIGSPHGDPIELSDDIKKRVKEIASKHGAWYEGDGKDNSANHSLFGDKKVYKGSWDDASAQNIRGYPTEYLAPLFSNVDVNKQHETFENPRQTIFDSLLSNQAKARYFKDRSYDKETLANFLKQGSEKDTDLLRMAASPATKDNLQKFFSTGEKLMWPDNWQEYPNNLGKIAKKFEDSRNNFLHNAPAGVYITGAGHIPELQKSYKDLNVIGGERAGYAKGGGAWTRKEGKNPNGGLNAKGRASLKAEGHDIKPPQPEGGARRDSFCARMKGMKAKLTSKETANDPNSRINKSLRAWNCHADGGVITDALRLAHKIQRKK